MSILALIHWSVCVPFLSSFALVSPCPSLPSRHFVVVVVLVVVGVHDEIIFAESVKKEQKNKRKTQKLGWLREPDRRGKRNAPGIGIEGSLPGFASVFRSRPVIKPYLG